METSIFFTKIKNLILDNLDKAEKDIFIAVAWFTNREIFDKLISLLETQKNVTLIILDDFINNGPFGLDFQQFIDKGGNLYYSTAENPVHHKFCIIDDKTVLTGSYNWTYYAEHKNYENVVKTENPDIIEKFISEYEQIVQGLIKIIKSIKYEEYNTNFNDFFGSKEYLSEDLLIRGINLNKYELIETAKKINNTNSLFIERADKLFQQHLDKPIPKISIPQFQDRPHLQKSNTIIPIIQSITNNESLGICTRIGKVDDRFSILIRKGTKLPTTHSSLFYTSIDNQTSVSVNTHKGEHLQASLNPLIGKILINDLPPLPAGKASIKVTFSLNEKGDLNVTVLSNSTGNTLEANYYRILE